MNIRQIIVATMLAGTLIPGGTAIAAPSPVSFKVDYTSAGDISQKNFTVAVGQKVRLQVNPKESATGCMSDIMIPGLYSKPQPLVKGKPVAMEFTPAKAGTYKITCSMGVNRGTITVK